MKVLTELSLALCCGFLGMGVSAWNAEQRTTALHPSKISGFLPAAQWTEALSSAETKESPILVYVGMSGSRFRDLENDLQNDPVLATVLKRFVPVAVFVDGSPTDRALAAKLNAITAPDFLVVSGQLAGDLQVQSLDTVTGSAYERFGLTAELWSIATGAPCAKPLAAPEPGGTPAPGIHSLAERYARLRNAVETFQVPIPADTETSLDVHLATESHAALRYLGWSLLATWLERCARAAERAGGEYLGVPRARWEARLRKTTRRSWISCPDDRLLPLGGLLIQRYARAPQDLDSLDRAFMAAVIRTLSKAPGADKFPGEDWLEEARASLPPK